MLSHEQILEKAMASVAAQVAESVKSAVVAAVEQALSTTMHSALVENEFYRHINDEMRHGLQSIYKEITAASSDNAAVPDSEKTGKLFSEASQQLEEVMATTLEATDSIMNSVEQLQDRQQEIATLLVALQDSTPGKMVEKLAEHSVATEEALTDIMTALSFQDLTGQRLKKVVKALTDIQESIFDMYVSSGLMLKTREEMPGKDITEIAAESKKKMEQIRGSELKGPSRDVSQTDVDSLLADLGL